MMSQAPICIALSAVLSLCLFSSAFCDVEEKSAQLLVVGATESGWAAAVHAARLGVEKIIIVHDGEWFGGQFTEQALACVDENKGVGRVGWGVDWHPMKRSFHRSGLFLEVIEKIELQNLEKYGDRMPGKPWHGPTTFRPKEAESAFREIIDPYLKSGQVEVIWRHYPVGGEVDRTGNRPRLNAVEFAPVGSDECVLRVKAPITIDASDWGEVIQVSGAAYECGPDPQSRYGEPSAPTDMEAFPHNEMNPITWCMIVAESDEMTSIPKPPYFDDRNYPRATRIGKPHFDDLKWDRKARIGGILHWPDDGEENSRMLSVYSVRRIVEGATSKDGKTSILLCYMNGQDYPLTRLPERVVDQLESMEPGASKKNIVEMTRAQREVIFQDSKNHSLGVLYHLQNFVHDLAPDKANSFRNFHLSSEFGTEDNLPPKPYIREALRLKAMYMMREQDGRNRDGETKVSAKERFTEVMYPDGLFAWQFHYDFHRTGRTYLEDEGGSGPWIDYEKEGRNTHYLSDRCVFPARSLIPVEMDGLLGAQKNVGYSSVVSSAIRLHDQCIHVGQASGALAAVSLREGADPREVPYDRGLLEKVRSALCGESWGRPLLVWPWRDLPVTNDSFVAVNRLSALGCIPIRSEEVDFRPDDPAEDKWIAEVKELTGKVFSGEFDLAPPEAGWTRGEFAKAWWTVLEESGAEPKSFPNQSSDDADGDGIENGEDALLFTPNEPIVWGVNQPMLTQESDGLWPEEKMPLEMRFNFGGADSEGVNSDEGGAWSEAAGFGWRKAIKGNRRKRSAYPENYRDTFLYTRSEDIWEVAVQKGSKYEVTVCVGDSGHNQEGHHVSIEGVDLIQDEPTASGAFIERVTTVKVDDGKLTVTIGKAGSSKNTCLCWLILRQLPAE